MRVTTVLAFIAGYGVAHYGLLDGRWESLSPETQLFVSMFGVVIVAAILFEKLYVGPKVSRRD